MDSAPDAPPADASPIDQPPDQPPALTCAVCGPDTPCTINGTTQTSLGSLTLGPIGPNTCGGGTAPCDFFVVPSSGPNMGKKTLFLLAGLPNELNVSGTNTQNLIGIELVSTDGSTFTPGTTPFSTAPDAFTSSNVLTMPMGTTPYAALAYVLNVSGASINTVYSSTSGSVTVTAIPSTGDEVNGAITGTVGATDLAETDGAAFITSGCTTTLDGLSFSLTQGSATFAKPDAGGQPTATWQIRQRAIYDNLKAYLRRR